MITPDYLAELPQPVVELFYDLEDYIIGDIARRIKETGTATRTAEIQRDALQAIGGDVDGLNRKIAEMLEVAESELDRIFAESVEVAADNQAQVYKALGVKQDLSHARKVAEAMAKAATNDLRNLTGTAGYIMNNGQFSLMTDAYKRELSIAQMQVLSGAVDHTTAIRNAMKPFTRQGLTSVGYESGRRMSIEAVTRQGVLNGVRETIRTMWEDDAERLGTDGWELSAHANCAPDHEDIQGRQFTNVAYEELNASLVRPIGTLNCHHIAFPVLMGVSVPAHSEAELAEMKRINAEGITYEGKHYTGCEATQVQRRLERAIRKIKRELIEYDEGGMRGEFTATSTKLRRQRNYYADFTTKAGLTPRGDRTQASGYGRSVSGKVVYAEKTRFTAGGNGGIMTLNKSGRESFAKMGYDDVKEFRVSNLAARQWYKEHVDSIPSLIDTSQPLEEQARQAHALRNEYRTQTRNIMKDQEARKRLDTESPNESFDETLSRKMYEKGLTQEEAFRDIIGTATKTNEEVNRQLGFED